MAGGLPTTLITFIIVPAINNHSAPGQKHGHRGKSPSFHRIGPRNYSRVLMVLECIVLEDRLWGSCFRGFPGTTFGRFFGPRGGTINPGRNDYKRYRSNQPTICGGMRRAYLTISPALWLPLLDRESPSPPCGAVRLNADRVEVDIWH